MLLSIVSYIILLGMETGEYLQVVFKAFVGNLPLSFSKNLMLCICNVYYVSFLICPHRLLEYGFILKYVQLLQIKGYILRNQFGDLVVPIINHSSKAYSYAVAFW